MTQMLARGGNVGIDQARLPQTVVVTLTWEPAAGADADLSAFLCGPSGKVRSDEDFVFYNQPTAAPDFFAVTDDELIGRNPISDDALFERLMTEYPDWLRRARVNGLLRP